MDPAQAALTAGSTADATVPMHALPPRRGMARVRFAPTAMADAIATLSDEPSAIQRVAARCEPAIEHALAELRSDQAPCAPAEPQGEEPRPATELAVHTTEMLDGSPVNDELLLDDERLLDELPLRDDAPSGPPLDDGVSEVSDDVPREQPSGLTSSAPDGLPGEQPSDLTLSASDLEQAPLDLRAADTNEPAGPALDDLRLRPAVAALEQVYIAAAMTRTGGNQTQAARLLGLSRFGLQKKLRRLADGDHGDGDERSVSCTSA
jgi:hypothetical protein